MTRRAEHGGFGDFDSRIIVRRQGFIFAVVCFTRQFPADLIEKGAVARAQDTVIAHLVEALGEYVLEKAANELR